MLGAALLVATSGCGCSRNSADLIRGPHRVSAYSELAGEGGLRPGEDFRVFPVERGQNSSLAIISIRDRETPHMHGRYDLNVLLVQGKGTLWLQGTAHPMRVGDTAFIPKGASHYFVNESDEPAAALVTFAPPFDGPDAISLPPDASGGGQAAE